MKKLKETNEHKIREKVEKLGKGNRKLSIN